MDNACWDGSIQFKNVFKVSDSFIEGLNSEGSLLSCSYLVFNLSKIFLIKNNCLKYGFSGLLLGGKNCVGFSLLQSF